MRILNDKLELKHLVYFFLVLFLSTCGKKKNKESNNSISDPTKKTTKPAQTAISKIKAYEGIWIEEDFMKSFDRTKTIIKSRDVIPAELPVGLRINTNEILDNKLNIGFSVLHGHSVYPEVSRFILHGTDTLFEMGSLTIDLNLSNDKPPFNVGNIPYFNNEIDVSFLSEVVSKSDTQLVLYNQNSGILRYKRFCKISDLTIPFSNPLYCYTRKRILTGEYKLFSGSNKLLSTCLTIKDDGSMTGFKDLENRRIYYSTDVFCGMPLKHDVVEIKNLPIENEGSGEEALILKRTKRGALYLYKYDWDYRIAIDFGRRKEIKYILEPR